MLVDPSVVLLLFLARAWCTIPVADLPQVWCAGFRRCLFSLFSPCVCGFSTALGKASLLWVHHRGRSASAELRPPQARDDAGVVDRLSLEPGCVPPTSLPARARGLKFGRVGDPGSKYGEAVARMGHTAVTILGLEGSLS